MRSIPKPLAGLVFLLFWGIAIALWSCTHLLATHEARGFMADIGIVFASIGLAAPFLLSMKQLLAAAILGVIGIVFFGLFGFADATVLVYLLRLLVPFLALLTPVYKLLSFRVFA